MLVPVIGLVQVGSQSMADRYTYLPGVGLTIAVAWGVSAAARRYGVSRQIMAVAGGAVSVILIACTFVQAGYWRDTLTLFSHAIDATGPDNNLAQWYVAGEYLGRGDDERALQHYLAALRVKAEGPRVQYLVGNILQRRGDFDEAIKHYQAAIEQDPNLAEAYNNLGAMYGNKGDLDRAEFYFREALRVDPDMELARSGLERVRQLKAATRQ
jgi:tetratricopeptide (TPR) repeat protein